MAVTPPVCPPATIVQETTQIYWPYLLALGGLAWFYGVQSEKRRKVDLFDKRWIVYKAARDLIETMGTGRPDPEIAARFLRDTLAAPFLFDTPVSDYLTKDLWTRAAEMQLHGLARDEAARTAWRADEYAVLDQIFGPYLHVCRQIQIGPNRSEDQSPLARIKDMMRKWVQRKRKKRDDAYFLDDDDSM